MMIRFVPSLRGMITWMLFIIISYAAIEIIGTAVWDTLLYIYYVLHIYVRKIIETTYSIMNNLSKNTLILNVWTFLVVR